MVYIDTKYPQAGPLVFAVPNGGFRTWRQGAKLKREGVKPGTADIVCLCGTPNDYGFVLELKQPNNRPSPEQDAFLSAARSNGFRAAWVDTWDDAQAFVDAYFSNEG